MGGKGGVGKTTTAGALSLVAAGDGHRTLLVSTDPAHSLADLFGREIGNKETPLAPSLWGLEIDPDHQADAHLGSVKARMKHLVHPRSYGEIDRQLDLARLAPGTMEAAMLERVAEIMATVGHEYDQIVFDTAPTGHTVRLLSLSEVMAAWTDGLLGHRGRAQRLGSALRHLGGGRVKGDDLSLVDAAADYDENSREQELNDLLLARRRKFIRAREQLLDQQQSAFVLVLNPDRLSVLESVKANDTLRRVSIPVRAVIVNRVLPAEATGDFLDARRRQEGPHLQEIDRVFAHLPRMRVPLLPDDIHGIDALQQLSELLLLAS